MPTPRAFTAELTVEPYLHGVRIDTFLERHFRNYTSFRLQRMVAAGLVAVNAARAAPDTRVFRGQHVAVRLVEPPDKLLDAEPLPLDVLFEDPWLVVVNKPAGQITHPVGEYQTGSLCHALQWHLDRQTPLPGLLRPGIVHRLDRMTSGVLVATKQHHAHRVLSIMFQRGRVTKTYLALVEGSVSQDRGTINVPIGSLARSGSVLMTCGPDAHEPRRAVTHFEVVRRFARTTLVRASPVTGRNHQVRVHLAHIGHPVVGDEFYGPFGRIKLTRAEAARSQPARHALHAARLTFRHPFTREELTCTAPPPADFDELCRA